MAPDAPGTLISLDTDKDMIKAVAAKDNITMIRIRSNHQLSHWSFMGKVFALFEHHCIPIDNDRFDRSLYLPHHRAQHAPR